MQVFQYILISSVCLSAFYIAYRLIFRNETHFRQLRIYLLVSILISGIVPLNSYKVNLGISIPGNFFLTLFNHGNNEIKSNALLLKKGYINQADIQTRAAKDPSGTKISWPAMLVKLYLLVAMLLLARILLQLIVLSIQYKKSEKIHFGDCVIIYNHRFKSSFSFFKWIFIPRDISSDEDLEQIIAHEKIHASQFHSFDLIVIELLAAAMWFNPLIWMMKNSMQLVHEYLADEGALSTGIDKLRYQALLINQITEESLICLSSSFNHSLIKKRMKMMTKSKFYRRTKLKILTLIPLSISLLFFMACINGMFPVSLQAGTSPDGTGTGNFLYKGGLNSLNPGASQDTIKKKTIITKIINKDNKVDTVTTETLDIIVSGDTTRKFKVIVNDKPGNRDGDLNMIYYSDDNDTDILDGSTGDSVRVVKIINRKSTGENDKKVETIIIRTTGEKQEEPVYNIPSNTLTIIDGVKHTDKKALEGIDPDQIISVSVIKDKKMMKKYSDKEYDGVIIIKTKPKKD